MAKLAIGQSAIPFTILGTDQRLHSLSNYTEKRAIVLIFSCNHCPYVQAWEDRMIAIQTDYELRDVRLIAINSNDATNYPADSFDKMRERARQKRFNFPYLYDETQQVAHAYGAERTPEVFVFDHAGILRYHGAIDDQYESVARIKNHYLRDALDAILAGESPRIAETAPIGCTIKWKKKQ